MSTVKELEFVHENMLVVVMKNGRKKMFLVLKKEVHEGNDRVLLEGYFTYQILSNIKLLFDTEAPKEIIIFLARQRSEITLPDEEEKNNFTNRVRWEFEHYKRRESSKLAKNRIELEKFLHSL